MNHEFLLWVMLFCYALHILEEYVLNWRDWAVNKMGFDVQWSEFYVTNAIVVVGGACTAVLGWKLPELSLSFAALAIINAVFLHILPTLRQRHFSPGLMTAVLLFLPVGAICYWGAWVDGILSAQVVGFSAVGGALLMAYPIVLLNLKRTLGRHGA